MTRRAKRRRSFIVITLLLGILLGLLGGEVLVRVLGNTDADGNFWLGGRILGPQQPQRTRLTNLVEEFETREDASLFVYDAELGWNLRPGASSANGLYHIDERGIRTGARATPRTHGPIVALYGDSFTFCSEVLYAESWGHQLEELLAQAGKEHEVLNLGVGGYDMGQAYLRWRSTHAELQPGIVVFGFQPENVLRNLGLIRAFYVPGTKLPFSKPRFVLEGDELGLVNVPSLTPREMLEVLRNPWGWELLPLETFYLERERERSLRQHSRLLCLLLDRVGNANVGEERRVASYREGSEGFKLAVRIVQRFHDEVRAAGSQFVIVHLPNKSHLADIRAGRPMPHGALLAELARRGITVVDPTPELLRLVEQEGLPEIFGMHTHYASSSNRVVAEVLARDLRKSEP